MNTGWSHLYAGYRENKGTRKIKKKKKTQIIELKHTGREETGGISTRDHNSSWVRELWGIQ